MANDPKIVTHFVAGYPDAGGSLEVARGLISGGAFALELQIPFSDPTADGPAIEGACNAALAAGFTVVDAWTLLETLRAETAIPIFVMSYASLAVANGVVDFCRQAAAAGATGLIIPDLPPGSDEGLYAAAREAGCPAVPVLVPWVTASRLEEILSVGPNWLYVALRSGITGTYTDLGPAQEAFLDGLRDRGARVMAGFGIQDAQQVRAVTRRANAAVVGSALVRVVSETAKADLRDALRQALVSLRGVEE